MNADLDKVDREGERLVRLTHLYHDLVTSGRKPPSSDPFELGQQSIERLSDDELAWLLADLATFAMPRPYELE